MRTTRSLVAAASLATGVLLAGCAPGATGGFEQDAAPSGKPKQQNALADFNPCKALSSEQAQSLGASPEGEPDDTAGESGCEYEGDDMIFSISKNPEADEQYWQDQNDKFDKKTPNTVGSHNGFAGIAQSGLGQGGCRQIMYSGQGSAIVDVVLTSDEIEGSDACSKATEIAEQIEPKLPA